MLTVVYLSQQCMAKRFDGSQQALDLNNIRTDPGYYTHTHIDLTYEMILCNTY